MNDFHVGLVAKRYEEAAENVLSPQPPPPPKTTTTPAVNNQKPDDGERVALKNLPSQFEKTPKMESGGFEKNAHVGGARSASAEQATAASGAEINKR